MNNLRALRSRWRRTAFQVFAAILWAVCFTGSDGAVSAAEDTKAPVVANGAVPKLHTNQAYIEDIAQAAPFDIADPAAVFRFIFSSLPNEVRVYPTENYYYFNFYYRGVPYSGNLRLAADDRDDGKIHFAYFRDYRGWFSEEGGHYKLLGAKAGVRVEKVEKLAYKVSENGHSVLFRLNDLSGVSPPDGLVRKEEIYIGPVFDESGLQFFLVYNPAVKLFHYILNETGNVPERLVTSTFSDKVMIGNRSGFAFYRDQHKDRKIMIGVYNGNANINNYFDGPFDQLPDNFLDGDVLKKAILDTAPDMEGKIDRYGNAPDKENRFMIAPYRHYWLDTELSSFDDCANKNEKEPKKYYACFVAEEEQD